MPQPAALAGPPHRAAASKVAVGLGEPKWVPAKSWVGAQTQPGAEHGRKAPSRLFAQTCSAKRMERAGGKDPCILRAHIWGEHGATVTRQLQQLQKGLGWGEPLQLAVIALPRSA